MPMTISLYAFGVWICVGIAVGFGWAFGSWLFGKIAR